MKKQTKIENLLKKLLQLHDRKIDLSLDRSHRLNRDLKINLDRLRPKTLTFSGTNGKFTTATTMRSIFEAANYSCDFYSSPHVESWTERFVFESNEITEEGLFDLLSEVSLLNKARPATLFEILTSAFYFYSASKSKCDVVLAENGLFQKYDAVSSIGNHLLNATCAISLDHLDWLPEGKKTIDQIIIEKTSNIKSSYIVVSKQNDNQISEKIKQAIKNNSAKKIFFSDDYNYEINNEGFLYKDKFGYLQLPKPNLPGNHMIANAACAVAAIRNLKKYTIKEEDIINGIKSVKNIKGRLEILNTGPLKNLATHSTIYLDIASNPDAGLQISKFLDTLDKNKGTSLIVGMINTKMHFEFLSCFKKVNEIVAIDIPNNKNCIKKEELKKIIEKVGIKAKTENSIEDALKYLAPKSSTILVVGSIYLIGALKNLGN